MERLKCLMHRIMLQQLLGQDFLQPPPPPQPPLGHLHALLEQPPDRASTAESLADRILEWAADRQPQPQPHAALPQPQAPPSTITTPDSAGEEPFADTERPTSAASQADTGSGIAEGEDIAQPEVGGRRAWLRGRSRGTWRDGDDSGAASVSGSDRGGASSLASPGNGTPLNSCQMMAAGADHQTEEARSIEQPQSSAFGTEGPASPEAIGAIEVPRAADVGHLTPTAMHAGLRVAEARAKAAKLGAQLDRVLAVRAGGRPMASAPTI